MIAYKLFTRYFSAVASTFNVRADVRCRQNKYLELKKLLKIRNGMLKILLKKYCTKVFIMKSM